MRGSPLIRWASFFCVLGAGLALAGCLGPVGPKTARAHAARIAQAGGFAPIEFAVGPVALLGYIKTNAGRGAVHLHVYIEGDGRAWVRPGVASADPTPWNPIGLRLALADPGPDILYLARPCQYIDLANTPACTPGVWTRDRFSPAAIDTVHAAIEDIAAGYRAEGRALSLTLIGYSGGGVVAAVIAADRTDVERLITVAAPLDTAAWTREHEVDSVAVPYGMDQLARKLRDLDQHHYLGAKDRVVPPGTQRGFHALMAGSANFHLTELPGFDHSCCWARDWPELLRVR